MITIQCAICEEKQKIRDLYPATFAEEKLTKKTFSARRTPDRLHYRFVICRNCGLIFSNPILPLKKITQLYKESSFSYDVEAHYLRSTYGQYLEKVTKGNSKQKLTLLDIGCGNGFFLEEAIARGIFNVAGVEPGIASVKKASKPIQKLIKVAMFSTSTFPEGSFDIICCFHTLDHIVDPNAFLSAVYKTLKKGGKAYFIVHDTNGLSVKLFGEKSPIFDIEHVYLFNKKTLARLFKKNKFTVVETFSIKNSYPLNYWLRMVPLPKSIKSVVLTILEKSQLGRLPITIRAGNIGIIAEK